MKEIGTPGVKRDSAIDIEKECGHFLPKVFHPQKRGVSPAKEGCFTRKRGVFHPQKRGVSPAKYGCSCRVPRTKYR